MLFSSFIQKTNRFDKCADRALLVTDSAIYKLDTKKFKAMKKGSPIQEVHLVVLNIVYIKLSYLKECAFYP